MCVFIIDTYVLYNYEKMNKPFIYILSNPVNLKEDLEFFLLAFNLFLQRFKNKKNVYPVFAKVCK